MLESLFGVSLHMLAGPRRSVTDSGAPAISPVPVYVIHSFERPFCQKATCACQRQQQEVVRVLVSIIEGRVELEPAAVPMGTDRKEPHA